MCKVSFILMFFSLSAMSQSEVEATIEQLFDLQNISNSQLLQLQDELEYYLSYPLSIQTTDVSTLEQHPLINLIDATNLSMYISKAGELLDWGELTNVYGIDEDWIALRKPYISLARANHSTTWKPRYTASKLLLGIKVDDYRKRGYRNGEYLGSPFQDQGKLEVSAHPYRVQLRWQRDAGERFLPLELGIYDHVTGFLEWRGHRQWSVGLGHYRVGRFMGTMSGVRFGSGIPQTHMDIHSRPSQTGLSAGAAEVGLWRGAAVKYQHGKWGFELSSGYSKMDARIERGEITSTPQSGLHRTQREIYNSNTLQARHLGWMISRSIGSLRISAAQDFYHLHVPNILSTWEGGTSLYFEGIFPHDFIEVELANDINMNFAGQIAWTRSLGDLHVGLRAYKSEMNYRNGRIHPEGYLFSGDAEHSMVGLIEYRQLGWIGTISLYQGSSNSDPWSERSKRGLQLNFQERFGSKRVRYKWSENDRDSRHYFQISWPLAKYISQRAVLHFQNLRAGSFGSAFDFDYRWSKCALKVRCRFQVCGIDQLPIYFLAPTTRLQMQIQALNRTGYGLDLRSEWRLTSGLKLQAQISWDTYPLEEVRGSGHDETPGPHRWSASIEAHLALH